MEYKDINVGIVDISEKTEDTQKIIQNFIKNIAQGNKPMLN